MAVAESEEINVTDKHTSDSYKSKLEAFLSTCKVLLPSQGVKREVVAINPNQLIPGCRVEFIQKSNYEDPKISSFIDIITSQIKKEPKRKIIILNC